MQSYEHYFLIHIVTLCGLFELNNGDFGLHSII